MGQRKSSCLKAQATSLPRLLALWLLPVPYVTEHKVGPVIVPLSVEKHLFYFALLLVKLLVKLYIRLVAIFQLRLNYFIDL